VSRLRTFLIADMRGYTAYTVQQGDAEAARVAAGFAAVARRAVEAREGTLLELRGDEALAVFDSARQALRAAVDLQRLRVEVDLPLPIGIGLDAGEAVPVEGGFRGAALNLSARLCSLAGPDEVLASETVTSLARRLDDLTYADRGAVRLKGFSEDVRVRQILQGMGPVPADVPASDVEQGLTIGSFLGALPATAIVGRDDEMQRAAGAVEAVAAGSGRLLLLSGEPGVGKTRLAQEVTRLVYDRSFIIAVGRCYEPYRAVPFYPFLDAIRTVYGAVPPTLRQAVAARWPQLGRLMPDQALPAPPPTSSAHEEQQRTYWAVTSFLQAAAEWRPLSILLDDLHWADSPSLELLQHLTEHTRESRILLLGTYRDTDIDRSHPLARVMLDLTRERLADRLHIARLDAAETASLVADALGGAPVSEELASLVFRHTGGNAFFAEELARSLAERGDLSATQVDDLQIPETVRSVIAERVSRLSEDDQEMVIATSVLGQTFSFDDALAVTGKVEDVLDTALTAAVALGMVREMGDDRYMFNHTLTQASLYTQLSPRRRRRLHRAAAEALDREPDATRQRRASELARHYREAGEMERALPWLVRLGDQAEAAWSHDDAARQYDLALQAAVEIGDRAMEAVVCEKLGGLLTAVIRYAEALQMLERASQIYAALDDVEGEARTVAQMGRVHLPGGSAEAGIVRITAALDSLGARVRPQAQAELLSSLARCLSVVGRHDEALQNAEATIALVSGPGGSSGVLSEATVTRGAALAMLGRWEEAARALREAVARAEVGKDLFSACRGLQYIAGIELARGTVAEARSSMDRALSLATLMQNGRQMATCTLGLATISFLSGDPDTARKQAERVLPVMKSLGGFYVSVLHSAGLSLSLAPGEWTAVPPDLKEALLLAESSTPHAAQRTEQLMASRALEEGRLDAARSALDTLLRDTRLEAEQRAFVDQLVAEADVLAGRSELGLKRAVAGLEHAAAENLTVERCGWLRVLGLAHAALDQWDQSSAAFSEAADLARQMPYPLREGRILQAWGTTLLARGQVDGGRQRLDEASVLFRRLGARDDEAAVQAALAGLS
jgi:class 3 adenylate cyclase/tetratricopeptide (TPR) repeat protein